jgi:hypothetical protein
VVLRATSRSVVVMQPIVDVLPWQRAGRLAGRLAGR